MSESVIRGKISNFSPKPDDGYYGICIDEGDKGENWYNGEGSIPDGLEKNQKVKIKINPDRFCEIDKINVLEPETSEDASRREEAGPNGSAGKDSGPKHISKDESIIRQVAFKEACNTVREMEDIVQGDRHTHTELVETYSNDYYEILKRIGENQ